MIGLCLESSGISPSVFVPLAVLYHDVYLAKKAYIDSHFILDIFGHVIYILILCTWMHFYGFNVRVFLSCEKCLDDVCYICMHVYDDDA